MKCLLERNCCFWWVLHTDSFGLLQQTVNLYSLSVNKTFKYKFVFAFVLSELTL